MKGKKKEGKKVEEMDMGLLEWLIQP